MKKYSKLTLGGGILFVLIVSILVIYNKNNNEKIQVITSNNIDKEIFAFNIKNETGEYEKVKNIPVNGYLLNEEESYCGLKQDDNTYTKEEVSIAYKNGKVTIDKVNKYGTKCFLYFDKAPCKGVACEVILANNSIDTSRSSGEFTSTFEENTAGRIFNTLDDDGVTYFFAGAEPNNWVQFADKWWRIVRINGDGSVRLIYSGSDATKEPQLTGADTHIGTSKFNEQLNDNAYVGYMYGTPGSDNYNDTHANINDSAVKKVVDKWYQDNLLNTNYEKYIDINAGFCGDRSLNIGSEPLVDWDTKKGYGKNVTVYGLANRLLKPGGASNEIKNVLTPTYKCGQVADLYTINNANKGNKKLVYPVGLITGDEGIYAGGSPIVVNYKYYLYTGEYYWTMSPYIMHESNCAYVVNINRYGTVTNGNNAWNPWNARPVINLKANTELTGSGTISDPYVVVSL